MTVRLSYDEGKTWGVSKVIHEGSSVYSCLMVMKDGSIGLLYEGGEESRYDAIRVARFNLEWLSDGKDEYFKKSKILTANHSSVQLKKDLL